MHVTMTPHNAAYCVYRAFVPVIGPPWKVGNERVLELVTAPRHPFCHQRCVPPPKGANFQ